MEAPAAPRPDFDSRQVSPGIRMAMRLLELEQTAVPSLADLADRVGLSAGYMSRQFAAVFGESPASYGRRIRLDHAATRLLFSPIAVSELASDFGFQNQPAFNRAFRRQHGMAPTSLVEQLRASMPATPPLSPAPVVRLTERPAEPALCRRFFGPDIAGHWRQFWRDLPLERPERFAGLTYDFPAIVSEPQRRYDCAIPVRNVDVLAASMPVDGLDAIELPGGLHAKITGCSPAQIGPAIRHLYAVWLPTQPTLAPEGDPMIHWWGEVPGVTVTIRLHRLPDPPAPNVVPFDNDGTPAGYR